MPPKRKAEKLAAADRAAAAAAAAVGGGSGGLWSFRADPTLDKMVAWIPYHAGDNAKIEEAYAQGAADVPVSNGYTIDLKRMVQRKISDPSKQRQVRRTAPPPTADVVVVDDDEDATNAPSVKAPRAEGAAGTLARGVSDVTAAESSGGGTASAVTPTAARASTVDEASQLKLPSASCAPVLPPGLKRATGAQLAVIGSELLDLPDGAPAPVTPSPIKGDNPRLGKRSTSQVHRMPHASIAAIISRVVRECPAIHRGSLDNAASKMHPGTRSWLQALGRPAAQKFMGIALPVPLAALNRKDSVTMSPTASVAVGDIQGLANAAHLSCFDGPLPSPVLVGGAKKLNRAEYRDARRMMVSGPVLVLYGNDYEPVPAPPPTVVMCSTPGINFAYSAEDTDDFTSKEDDMGPRVLDKQRALAHMVKVWAHVLVIMDEVHRVQFPVLCAIGCGAFRGKFGSLVPRLWAQALHTVLSTRTFKHISAVFVSAPTFGDANNYAPFAHTLRAAHTGSTEGLAAAPVKVPVIVTEDMSMVTLAADIARLGYTAGILNPSDVEAMRKGYLGMYWDGGHIAVEEILAMQTSLLLQHVGVNPELFSDPTRQLRVDL